MRKLVIFGVLVAAVALTTAVTAMGDDGDGVPAVQAQFIAGNTSNVCAGGQKLDGSADGGVSGDLESGSYPFFYDGTLGRLVIEVSNTPQGPVFAFDTTNAFHLITSIYVKGGPNGSNFYDYSGRPGGGSGHDDGLHSPLNSKNGKWYGLSHICVFTDKKGA